MGFRLKKDHGIRRARVRLRVLRRDPVQRPLIAATPLKRSVAPLSRRVLSGVKRLGHAAWTMLRRGSVRAGQTNTAAMQPENE